ncbi:DUF362 domain-containing protein [Desulfohalovibrio reitneri]|uniref:DUF362 domain-containing protein n=1 Tax=Desulfohalovibrio reitneri TaxID=1307759 RepID=UPI0004A70E1C|nr:DUF362 domain-containing protein [Desulfohalovibrio reitneri]
MASTVHFWNLRASGKAPTHAKLAKLLDALPVADHIAKDDLTAVKLHFGEAGVTGFLAPHLVKPIIDRLLELESKPFLTDTATLYVGQRGNAVDHSLLARRHGFDPAVLGAPVHMADGLNSTNETTVSIPNGTELTEAHLAADILNAEAMAVLSHFKGHIAAGFGGALKNLAMGCATRKGKMHQHMAMGPKLTPENCVGCGACIEVCAPGALRLDADDRITIDHELCVGCGGCFHACPTKAVDIDWSLERARFIRRMMEYASAVYHNIQKPAVYVNFILDVTPECDCIGFSDAPICPNLGIAASTDPLALDQACIDLVNQAPALHPSKLPDDYQPGQNKFTTLNKDMPDHLGLDHAETLGIGSREYVLKHI